MTHWSHTWNRIKGERGFSLIEQLVTVAIMAIVLVAGIAALSTAALGFTVTQSKNQAMNLAQEQMECIKALPFNPQNYNADCSVTEDGYVVTTDVVESGSDFPDQFTGSDKVRLIKINVLRGGNSILEIEELKVDRQ